MTRQEAIDKVYGMSGTKEQHEALEFLIPEVRELREFYERQQEDERIRKELIDLVEKGGCITSKKDRELALAYLEKQKGKMTAEEYESSELFQLKLKTKYANGYQDGLAQKEQEPAESISQLTVQGKGVYKICPRCKERMVRDDSMVYTSMPPQYRYECPKCGESECDTVMYDNPEMEEQKPADLPAGFYVTLPDGEKYYAKEMRCNGMNVKVVEPKPTVWSEEDEDVLQNIIQEIEWERRNTTVDKDIRNYDRQLNFLKSLPLKLKKENEEWRHYIWATNLRFDFTALIKYDNTDKYEIVQAGNRPKQEKNGVYILIKDIKPQSHWKPSEEQMIALLNAEGFLRAGLQHDSAKTIAELYEQLKKL